MQLTLQRYQPVKRMPCCGLVAFILAQPFLLLQAVKSWLSGEKGFRQSFQTLNQTGIKSIGGLMLAELAVLTFGVTLTIAWWQPDFSVAHATLAPLGKICSVLGHQAK
jgi:hypothetical protein